MGVTKLELRIILRDGEHGEATVQFWDDWADNDWIDRATFKCVDWAKEYVKLMGQDTVDVLTIKNYEFTK